MTTTPEQARELLDGATPGPWSEDESNIMNHDGDPLLSDGLFGDPNWYNDRDLTLMTAAPDLAQTIAGMRWEWRCEANFDGTWAGLTTWESSPDYARATMQRRHRYPTRLVRRLVGPAEVTE